MKCAHVVHVSAIAGRLSLRPPQRRSLEILDRTVMVATNPQHSADDIAGIVNNIGVAARVVLGGMKLDEADLRRAAPVDAQKFDLKVEA